MGITDDQKAQKNKIKKRYKRTARRLTGTYLLVGTLAIGYKISLDNKADKIIIPETYEVRRYLDAKETLKYLKGELRNLSDNEPSYMPRTLERELKDFLVQEILRKKNLEESSLAIQNAINEKEDTGEIRNYHEILNKRRDLRDRGGLGMLLALGLGGLGFILAGTRNNRRREREADELKKQIRNGWGNEGKLDE